MDLRLKREDIPDSLIKSETQSEIKPATTISQIVVDAEEIVNDSKSCFTRISIFFKRLLNCQCESSSNCVKKK